MKKHNYRSLKAQSSGFFINYFVKGRKEGGKIKKNKNKNQDKEEKTNE